MLVELWRAPPDREKVSMLTNMVLNRVMSTKVMMTKVTMTKVMMT